MQHIVVIVSLALRNLRRHLRRTLLTAAAMVIGGGLMMFSMSLGDGTHESWIDSGVRLGTGHIAIEHPDFRVSREIGDRLSSEARRLAEEALSESEIAKEVTGVSAKLIAYGLASSAAGARPAEIMAVDPVAEANFSTLDDRPLSGRYLEPGDRLAAYVGSGLAEALDLELGSRFVLTAQGVDGEIAGQLVRVTGVFRSGVPEVDQSLIHIPLGTAAEWLGSGNAVTRLSVLVRDSDAVDDVAERLSASLADSIAAGTTSVVSWREAMPELSAAVTVDDFGSYLIYTILFVIIGFGIVNTVLMSVLHRHREFGVLQALGLTPGETGTLVLVEGIVLTGMSSVIGVALGVCVTWFFWRNGMDFSSFMSQEVTFSGVIMDPVVIPRFRLARAVEALVFILTIGGLASVYPAFRAAKINVAEAMKFER